MRQLPWAVICCTLLVCPVTRIQAQEFDFTPVAFDSPALAASMHALAVKAVAQLDKTNDAAQIGDLASALLAAGDYVPATRSIVALHLQQQSVHGPVFLAVAMEIFANAKVAQAATGESFSVSYRAAYEKSFATLDDRLAYDTWYFVDTSPQAFGGRFRRTLEQYKVPTHLSLPQVIELVRGYAWWQAVTGFFPLIDTLSAAEWSRRYAIEDGVLVDTPDGAHISAIIVRPRTLARLPSLLNFGIYTYPWNLRDAVETASHGYVGVVGFSRGKYRSRDAIVPYEKDGADARALITWISLRPWSDGRVGMYAGSYNGFTQWSVLKDPPKALRAIMSSATAAPGIGEVMQGGIFQTYEYPWVPYTTKGPMLDEEGYSDQAHWTGLEKRWYQSGRPYRDLELIDGVPSPIYRRWLSHPTYDAYWQKMTPQGEEFARIRIPVLQTTGYFDGGQIGTLYYFKQHTQHNPHAEHTLLIGPYGHLGAQHQSDYVFAGYEIDPAALMDIHQLRYEWFDHVLKGAPRPTILQDTVNYEVMGANIWRHAPSLEAMSTHSVRLHFVGPYVAGFAADQSQNSRGYMLTAVAPMPDGFVTEKVDLADRSDADWLPPAEVVSNKLDIHNAVAFVSKPLPQDTEVSGIVRGNLEFSISKKDFDFNLRLYELTASGQYLQLTIPYLQRASLAQDRTRRHLLVPGARQQLPFTLPGPVSRLIRAGGRLVIVLGVNKERDAEINYGTGKEVSHESVADAHEPLQVNWFAGSFVDIPVAAR
jgi:putative CocE/NonD family hydrolase